ncbi:MAG TPA: IS701 family transposase [Chloroflexi bacterium]|nr:IS701 family transposase [Chloroflexota bacterium]
MRSRFWLIILLLVWIGQGIIGAHNLLPVQGASCQEVWFLVENLSALVVYQSRRRMLWPPPRSHARQRRRRCGKPPFRRPRVTNEDEEQTAQPERKGGTGSNDVFTPQRWGLSPDFSRELPERLFHCWQRYNECFKTKTRNTGEYAYHYMSGLLRIETKRNYTNIGRAAGVAGENIQHFMSNSPWSAQKVMKQVQQEIKTNPDLSRGGVVILDESADKKAGDKSAGAGRQYNGRLGKVDMSQIGTFLAYANLTHSNRPVWTWIDGELYLQKHWFAPEMTELRQQVGIPPEREFETKIELGWKMIQRVKANELPFEAIACDDLYGRSTWLRDKMNGEQILYMADVPRTTQVYLEKPILGVPERRPGGQGPKPTRLQVLNDVQPYQVHQVARRADTIWHRIRVRSIERGELNDPFAARRVWTLREGEIEPVEELLVIRREARNRYNYSLSNAPFDAPIEDLAWLKCQRYFVERVNQDAKSEAGWDELVARKYRGWVHHLALVILAVWFAAQTKWEWASEYTRFAL